MPSSLSPQIRHFFIFIAIVACVSLAWVWQNFHPQTIGQTQQIMQCVSYSPFYRGDSPINPNTHISQQQIQQDLTLLSQQFPCVRTYSVAQGMEYVPEVAQQLGMKVYLGVWIGWLDKLNRQEINTAIKLSHQYPNTIKAIVVGNEVLLRGEQKPAAMREYIHTVKQHTNVPVTYADVWEFWRKYKQLSNEVDFVTVHILPYWENSPVSVDQAPRHVEAVMNILQNEFTKPILIGETGWPSIGRQRFGSEPGLVNQARYISDFLNLAQKHQWNYNLIEAFDQPWKRILEGTVGGYWGLFNVDGQEKFKLGEPLAERNDINILLGCVLLTLLFSIYAFSRQTHHPIVWTAGVLTALLAGLSFYLQQAYLVTACRNYQEWLALTGLALISNLAIILTIYLLKFNKLKDKVDVYAYHARWVLLMLALGAIITSTLLLVDGRYRNFPNQMMLLAVVVMFAGMMLIKPKLATIPTMLKVLLSIPLVAGALGLLALESNNLSTQIWVLINLLLTLMINAKSNETSV
jgi:exo-beta-1,3-glucanase (GH17 family)